MAMQKTILHYNIIEKIGEGGMGVVYKAEDTRLKREVAIKSLPVQIAVSEQDREHFKTEARAAAALNHPNIATIYALEEIDEQLFIVMEYVKGQDLKKIICNQQQSINWIIDIAIQMAEGLKAAHDKGIVHRDIKSSNIMITISGQAKITDFGLAKIVADGQFTKSCTTRGTLAYMSPEQTRAAHVDHRSDIWSMGVVIYEMITGHLPFTGDYDEVIVYSIANEPPEPLTSLRNDVPVELAQIVEKALSKDSNERYQHVEEMSEDLQDLLKKVENEDKILSSGFEANKLGEEKHRRILLPTGLVIILALAFLLVKFLLIDQPLVSSPKPILVLSFENQTGDSTYNYLQNAIPNLLITNLEQSKYLRITTWEHMYDLLKQMGKMDVKVIDQEVGFELCRMDGVEAVIVGSYTKVGNTFATDVKVLDVASKQILTSASVKGEGEASILETQIDALSNKLSAGIGVSKPGMEEIRQPVAEITTFSLEAYNYFVRGRQDYYKYYFKDAKRALEKAVSIDSSFALAYLYLGRTYKWLKDDSASLGAFQKAKLYAGHTIGKEKSYIQASYAEHVEGDPEKKMRILLEMSKKFSKEKEIYWKLGKEYYQKGLFIQAVKFFEKTLELDPNHLEALNWCAYSYSKLKNYDKAIGLMQRYAGASPGDANPIGSLAEIYFHMGKLDESIAKHKEVIEIKSDFLYPSICTGLAYLYALREEYEEAEHWTQEYAATSRVQSCWWRGFYSYWLGTNEKAVQALNLSANLGWKAESEWLKGWIHLKRKEFEKSRRCFDDYFKAASKKNLRLSPPINLRLSAHHEICLGLLDLKEGRIDSTKTKVATIDKLIEQTDSFNKIELTFYRDLLKAEVFLEEGLPHKAIKICEELNPLEYGAPMDEVVQSDILYYNLPFPRDVLARAFMRIGDYEKAMREYERLMAITDLNNKERRLIRPEYHSRLARLYDEKGLTAKAIQQYEKYLAIQKFADESSPEYFHATARLAKLKIIALK